MRSTHSKCISTRSLKNRPYWADRQNCTAEDRARAANFASHARYFAARPGTVFGRPLHVGTSFKASIAPSRSLNQNPAGFVGPNVEIGGDTIVMVEPCAHMLESVG